MTMTYEVNEESGVIEIRIDAPVPMQEQQKILAEIIAKISRLEISKWLFVFTTTEQQDSEQARRFTEFVFDELKKYISKVAVVCDPALRGRAREVLAPIENQEKPVRIFASETEARTWLQSKSHE